MEDQQRRVAAVDVDDRAGQLRKASRVLGQGAQQQLERGPPHIQPEGRRLREDRHEIRGAVVVDDRGNVRRLVEVTTDGAFEFLVAVGHADERREVATRPGPGDRDPIRSIAVVGGLGAKETDRSLDIVNRRRKPCVDGLAKVQARHRKPVLDKCRRRPRLRAGPPCAAVHPDDQRRT